MSFQFVRQIFRPGYARLAVMAALLAAVALLALALFGSSSSGAQAQAVDPADLSITKSDSPDPVTAGGQLTYTIQVTNGGPDTAVNVVVTDELPSDINFDSATSTVGSCGNQGGKVTCNLGDLANGATATVTIKATVKNNAPPQVSNTASVSSDTADPQSNNNSDTETTTAKEKAEGPAVRQQDGDDRRNRRQRRADRHERQRRDQGLRRKRHRDRA
jgi:uncharacterized repeat protein (TIGR01451 family)